MIAIHLESFELFEVVISSLDSSVLMMFGSDIYAEKMILSENFFEHFEIVGFL